MCHLHARPPTWLAALPCAAYSASHAALLSSSPWAASSLWGGAWAWTQGSANMKATHKPHLPQIDGGSVVLSSGTGLA
eukprot:41830-Pelagomonas_calceolata.AAC.4